MKKGTNLILLGILSMLVGTVFASPLLVSELEIRPFVKPLPMGNTADVDITVVYANFSVGDTVERLTDISYFVVLNITNNSDECAVVNMVQFSAAQNITKGISSDSPFFGEDFTSSLGWEAEGAWVDGEWYNLTWVPNEQFWMNGSAFFEGAQIWENVTAGEGYWMEGVQLKDKAVGGNVTNMYMNMNGTWVDVTGRITWLDNEGNIVDINPERLPSHTSNMVTVSYTYFGESLTFGMDSSTSSYDPSTDFRTSINKRAPIEFSNLWAPHQSRLIALSSNRQVISSLLTNLNPEELVTKPITFRGSVNSNLNGTLGVYNSFAVDDEIKQVQWELTEDGYLYNVILSDDEMFVMDSFGVEVFIEPRSWA